MSRVLALVLAAVMALSLVAYAAPAADSADTNTETETVKETADKSAENETAAPAADAEEETAEDFEIVPFDSYEAKIEGVSAIGMMDVDGAKAKAIAVEYNVVLSEAELSADTYEVEVYTPGASDYAIDLDKVGEITSVYVNDKAATSETGGSGKGNYVIIELYTDYVGTSEPEYLQAMAVGVTQVKDIACSGGIVPASADKVINYTISESTSWDGSVNETHIAEYGSFNFEGLDGYQIYGTSSYEGYWKDLQVGDAWVEEDVFNEKDGTTYDYELGYALWVPEDYHADGSYALVTVDHTITGDPSPYEALLTNYGPSYFISDEAQQIVKDEHGLDGMIAVVPLIIERVDDNSCVPGMWMALVGLWDHLQDEYSIDPNYVYGAGQSMGGMLLMQTNTNRDNYFAGMLCYGNQWGQNYYKDTVFARGMGAENYVETAENTPRHYPSTASTYYIWDYHYDDNGEKSYDDHDPYNFYYLISDDNLMVFNGSTNDLSIGLWGEMSQLYTDLVGYSIPHLTGLNGLASLEEQNAMVNAFIAAGNDYNGTEMGIYECTWDGNGNDGTAIWSRRLNAGYEWLLKQSRETEMERAKLDINKPFELADEQLYDEAHLFNGFYDKDTGEQLYYLTAKEGSGTRFYNSSCLPTGTGPADLNPGWLPWNMSWETGVDAAEIQDITPIKDENGNYCAVAVRYDVDMETVFMNLVGDGVYNSRGVQYDDYFVTNPPFDFYDADGNKIDTLITNYYASDTAAVTEGAERGSGSGNYVIVEFDTPVSAEPASTVQRTTVITDTRISSATSKTYYAYDAALTDGIQSVYGLGFVDADGSKLEAIAIEYGAELDADSVSLDDFEIQDYGTLTDPSCELGQDPGVALKAYVSEDAEIGNPADSGRYVIVEVNTDYQLASVCSPYSVSMAAGAKQVGVVTTVDGAEIPAGSDFVVNYTPTEQSSRGGTTTIYPADEGTYFIYGIMDKYQLFYQEDGTAFHATDCFDEATGEYTDLDLPYALYIPEDYDENQEYMLVLQIEDAGFLGTDPMIALCESKAPANFASDEMQNYAKEQGYGGIIVVVPQIWEDIRTTRDNYTISSGVDATWQLMDYITDTYNVDMSRIYGTGQSMGGMQVIAMAAHRDNYFAGILEMGCQWGTNYDKDTPYQNQAYYNIFDTDDKNITFEDAENWFYAISDDNILITNCTGDAFSTSVWGEFAYLYYDIAGVEIPYDTVYPLEDSLESMNETVNNLVSQPNDTGIYWLSYTGGSHMLTWVYGHKIDASYYWLLSQTQESEDERGKLDLNNEYVKEDAVAASEYIASNFVSINNGASRLLGTDNNGITYFYSVPAEGSGTAGYNSAWMNMNGGAPSAECGWIPDPAYTVDSIKITDNGLTVAFSGTDDGTYTVEVYATTVGIGAATLVSSGTVTDGTYTDSSITEFDANVIYTVCLIRDGETVASAMHLDYDEGIVNGFVLEDGQWRYYVNGWFQSDLNSVVSGTIDGTTGKWYVLDGVAQLDFTGLCDYAAADGSWYYVTEGLVDTACTSVVQNSYGWWYVKDGKVDFSCNSVEQNDYGWWYVVGGKVDFSYTGVANYANAYGWWYISSGKVDFGFTGKASNNYGTWFCVNGKVDFSLS